MPCISAPVTDRCRPNILFLPEIFIRFFPQSESLIPSTSSSSSSSLTTSLGTELLSVVPDAAVFLSMKFQQASKNLMKGDKKRKCRAPNLLFGLVVSEMSNLVSTNASTLECNLFACKPGEAGEGKAVAFVGIEDGVEEKEEMEEDAPVREVAMAVELEVLHED